MRYFLFLVIFSISSSFCNAQTQSDLNESAQKKFLKVDRELNTVYQQILKEYKSDTAFIKYFKKAQKIWIQFRDAEMLAKYPDRQSGYYGSVMPMCWSIYKTELTEERTKKLKIWLTGIEEGDVCSGSVKIKD